MPKISEFPVFDENPFEVKDISTVPTTTKAKSLTMVSEQTGEVLHFNEPAKQFLLYKDSGSYLKLYRSGIRMIADLSRSGVSVLCLVMDTLRPMAYSVELSRPVAIKNGYTHLDGVSFYRGLADLLSHGVIARGPGSVYYINPNIVFNGDRTKKIRSQSKSISNE